MIPAWSLGVILLGSIFGFPVPFNSTHNGTRQYEYETLPQLNDTVGNSTQPFMLNDTESNETEIPFPFLPEETYDERDNNSRLPMVGAMPGCKVSLCSLNNLGHALNQGGDERAGGATRDPHGIGKR